MKDNAKEIPRKKGHWRIILGAIVMLLGLAFFIQNLTGADYIKYFWPLAIVALGIFFILRGHENS